MQQAHIRARGSEVTRWLLTGLSCFMCILSGCASGRPTLPDRDSAPIEVERRRQYEEAAALWIDHSIRISRVGSRLLVGNAPLCGGHLRHLGWIAVNEADMSRVFPDDDKFAVRLREAMVRRYAIGDSSRVIHVLPGSPGAQAGVQVGDILLSPLRLPDGDRLNVQLLRGDEVHSVLVEYVPQCPYSFSIRLDDELSALSDGTVIQVSTGMLRFARADDDLATVLAHELAHNILEYHLTDPASLGTTRIELEADYVGVYLAARAGFAISGTTDFLRRWGALMPSRIDRSGTHPGTAERVVRIEATVAEVEAKILQGEPLIPTGMRELQPER